MSTTNEHAPGESPAFAVADFKTQNQHFMSMVEHDMSVGNKRTAEDLYAYCQLRAQELDGTWRHRESRDIYRVVKVGLACTGEGRCVPMVHYVPNEGAPAPFERQLAVFSSKFERVRSTVVWEKA